MNATNRWTEGCVLDTASRVDRSRAAALLLALAGAVFAPGASGAIVSTTGPVIVSVPTGYIPSLPSTNFYAWNERTNISITHVVDTTSNPDSSPFSPSAVYSGVVNSHYIHMTTWTAVPGNPVSKTCSITFDQPIVAVIAPMALWLRQTDSACSVTTASPGQFHPGGERGFDTTFDSVIINFKTITLTVNAMSPGFYDPVQEVRVWTAVPAPGAASILALPVLRAARRRRGPVPQPA
ncbi:MAG: hypothetical protein IT436_03015 [Phycisphaerales bacterium]|nr:hypothetical protein [Phycisphaerales bacterium]